MIFRGQSFFPQILQNIKSVLRQKYFSYDILHLLIMDNNSSSNSVEVDFSVVLLSTTYKALQNKLNQTNLSVFDH